MPPTQAAPSRWYFVHPAVDLCCAGGLSLLAFGAAMMSPWYSESGLALPNALVFAGFLQWIINWPHFSATSFRLLSHAENRREFPLTTFVIPTLVGTGILSSLYWSETVAPYFIKFFMLWSPYHFTAQSLGISLLYARRAGYGISMNERRALSAFLYGTFLVSTARAEVSVTAQSYYGITYPGLGVPSELVTILSTVMYGGGALFLLFALLRFLKKGETLPGIIVIVAAAQFVWFVVGYYSPSFYVFVPAFHSLQYLLIAWVMELKENRSGRGDGKVTAVWSLINFLGGASLFWALPKVVHALGVPQELAAAVLISGVQIHHFFVDGVIWKLRNPRVANPLTVGWKMPLPSARRAA